MSPLVPTILAVLALVPYAQTDDWVAFSKWKKAYARQYNSAEDETLRFKIFQGKLRYYEARTANDTAVYGPDEFADRTKEEFGAARFGTDPSESCFPPFPPLLTEDVKAVLRENGTTVDWRTKGAVTPVKNQGQYGTCWSFGATGVVEGLNVAQGGNALESLSEQELIDCGSCGGYVGCSINTYYVDKHLSPDTEQSYPYRGSGGSCLRSSGTQSKAKVKKVVCERNAAGENQDNVLAQLQKFGPGGYVVDGDCLDGYRSGIISNCPKRAGAINHATLVVGAGEENGVPYFIVKNSWGESFGEQGYYRVKRNTNPPQLGNPGGIFGIYDSGDEASVLV